jgi:hypothetical protein
MEQSVHFYGKHQLLDALVGNISYLYFQLQKGRLFCGDTQEGWQ